MKAILLLLILIGASLFVASCSKVDSTNIIDITRDPASYANQDLTLIGRASREIAAESDSHFIYYIKDYSGQKIRLGCLNYELLHNQKYSIEGKFMYNNQTNEYSFRCTAPPKKVGGMW